MLSEARDLLSSTNIYLPNQVVVSSNIDSLESRVCDVRDVQDNEMILDQVLDEQAFNLISQAKQIIWNGPIGVFERDAFAQGRNLGLELDVRGSQLRAITSHMPTGRDKGGVL